MSFLACTNRNLDRLSPGFSDLSPTEKKRINEFAHTWQLFEGRVFEFEATAAKLRDADWFGQQAEAIFNLTSSQIQFFVERYGLAHNAQYRLNNLLTHRGENLRECITQALQQNATPEQSVRGVGAICFRLRNNLFHGMKAEYAFIGQEPNFSNGIRFLNTCIDVLIDA